MSATSAREGDLPNLGLATTAQLIDELRARIEVDYYRGGGGLGYTVMRGRPEALAADPNDLVYRGSPVGS